MLRRTSLIVCFVSSVPKCDVYLDQKISLREVVAQEVLLRQACGERDLA
jgi:hypothetical protein